MMFTNDTNCRIRITEDGNHLFHVERNCYTLSSKQSIWPWKPLKYEEYWSTLPIVNSGPFDSFGKAVKAAGEYARAIRSKVVFEATASSILDGTAFGGVASPDDYDREGGAE